MTNDDETVMIAVPVIWAEMRAVSGGGDHPVDIACRVALAARKTKYERWREMVVEGDISSRFWTVERMMEGAGSQASYTARLMAAAPQLLDALLVLANVVKQQERLPGYVKATRAIRDALPEDVADEELGVGK